MTPAADTGAPSVPWTQTRRQVVNRLRRAQGQLGAVISAVEADADCRDVVTQLAAVSSAVERAGFAIIAANMRGCLDPVDSGAEAPPPARADLSLQDLEKLFLVLH